MTAFYTDSTPPARQGAVIQAEGLDCRRGGRRLFKGLNLSVDRGDLLQVAGPNGCGKTTLLRILCGLRAPDQGVIRWQGVDIADEAEEFRANLIFVAFQSGLKLDLSPRENLQYAAAVGSGDASTTDNAIEQALERLGIAPWADVPCRQLSAGQVRRAALARLLVQQAGLWILDEPLTGLDREARATVEALMFEHGEQGGTVIFTTHHPLSGQHAGLRLLELST